MRAQEYASKSATITGQANATRKEGMAGGQEAGDAAPVTSEQESMASSGKYESAEPFRSRKGDRFS
jgi:hypothetical protein